MARSYSGSQSHALFRTLANNGDLIEALQDGPKHKRELASHLGVSSKTVYRRMRELQELLLAERGADGYSLTNVGLLHARMYEDVCQFSTDVYSADDLLSGIPDDRLPPYWLFRDADTVLAQAHAPNQPVVELGQLLSRATHVRGLSPVVLPQYVELVDDQIAAGDLTAEFLFESPVVAHLRAQYADELSDALEAGASILETDASLPFGLVVVEEPTPEVLVMLYGQANRLNGSLRTASPMAVEWAEDTFRSYRAEASEVS